LAVCDVDAHAITVADESERAAAKAAAVEDAQRVIDDLHHKIGQLQGSA
jgi:hypothetical protein